MYYTSLVRNIWLSLCLCAMFYTSLVRIPELAINPLGDRIVHAFFYESKSQGEEKVDFKVNCANISAGGLT